MAAKANLRGKNELPPPVIVKKITDRKSVV